jgi:hypothetical protein
VIHIEGVGYPTQGEVIRFLYAAAGVLPGKRDPIAPSGMDRKALQKALQRLAEEEGKLEEKFGVMLQELAFLVAGHIAFEKPNLAVGDVLSDLLDSYKRVICSEGTYLSKHDTLRWLVRDRWAPAAAISVARHITRYGLRPLAQYFPDVLGWYLPDWKDGKPMWPLQTVWRWIYARTGLSQTEFHYPGRNAGKSDVERQHDLQNAQNWLKGKHLPSAGDLRWNINRAFEARPSDNPGSTGMPGLPTALHQEFVREALFLARCATYVCQAIAEKFGEDFLAQVCKQFERDLELAMQETLLVEQVISKEAGRLNISSQEPELRAAIVSDWNHFFGERAKRVVNHLDQLNRAGSLTEDKIEELARAYGALSVIPTADWVRRPRDHQIPPGFTEAILEGLELSRDRALTDIQINRYAEGLNSSGIALVLPWMVPWLQFLRYYRCGDDTSAWTWISRAYEEARYRAGAKQYEIVNHYIEMAAKAGDRVAFRNGVNWARYVGIEVRWLRDKEPSPENIDVTMDMLRLVRYGV